MNSGKVSYQKTNVVFFFEICVKDVKTIHKWIHKVHKNYFWDLAYHSPRLNINQLPSGHVFGRCGEGGYLRPSGLGQDWSQSAAGGGLERYGRDATCQNFVVGIVGEAHLPAEGRAREWMLGGIEDGYDILSFDMHLMFQGLLLVVSFHICFNVANVFSATRCSCPLDESEARSEETRE